jgi:hypothetical protein
MRSGRRTHALRTTFSDVSARMNRITLFAAPECSTAWPAEVGRPEPTATRASRTHWPRFGREAPINIGPLASAIVLSSGIV